MSKLKNKENFESMVTRPVMQLSVGDKKYDFLSEDTMNSIESKILEIKNFMSENDGKGKSNEKKDKLYATAQVLWNELSSLLNSAKFGLVLNRPQYVYMTNLLLEKMEYDVNLLFFAIELSAMLKGMYLTKETEKYNDDVHPIVYALTATDITYLYHVLQQHKVKGLKSASFTFADIIRRIGDISKIFGFYDNQSKELSTSIQDWVVGFEEPVK